MPKQRLITENLASFYTAEADKFYNSRKKSTRPEFEYLLEEINKIDKEYIYILELGCGDGRFYDFLKQNYKKSFRYIWVDVSDGLIDLARQHYPAQDGVLDREVGDMLAFTSLEALTNKYDLVVSIAAVQHIYSEANRVKLFNNIYNITSYEGKFMMTNWSLSYRFIRKYKRVLRKSFVSKMFWNHDFYDLYIPWKTTDKTYDRYYHMFWVWEIKQLCLQTNRIIDKLWYIDNKSDFVDDREYSRNSLLIATKDVIK